MPEKNAEGEQVLVPESLQETLWRLEEMRRGFRSKSIRHVEEALQWVLSRQGLQGSYCGLFAPTAKDLSEGLRLLTGESYPDRGALTRHVLGEEALRAAILWNLKSSRAVHQALQGFHAMMERGGEKAARQTGFYCCPTCSIAFLRSLSVARPDNWDSILEKGISNIRTARTSDGRWRGFPFYYTLLTLSEMETSSADAELRHASNVAERLLNRYRNRDDRISRFRKLGLEATAESG